MKSAYIPLTILLAIFFNSQFVYAVSPQLVEAIIQVESGGNPRAYNKRSGAIGLGQFIPSTYRSLGYTKQQMLNPDINRKAMYRYLGMLKVECRSNQSCMVRSYFAGYKGKNKRSAYRYEARVLSKMNKTIKPIGKVRSKAKRSSKRQFQKPMKELDNRIYGKANYQFSNGR
jgi:soluble lytic murein transglycosylase-like protein